jgi:hypothetical protein
VEDVVRIVLVFDHLQASVLRTVCFLDPSILFSRKNIDVRARTEHVRSQCVEQGTHPLAFRGQLLWSGTGGSEVHGVTRSPPATEGCVVLADLAVGLIEASEDLTCAISTGFAVEVVPG